MLEGLLAIFCIHLLLSSKWYLLKYHKLFKNLIASVYLLTHIYKECGLPLWLSGKEYACNAGDVGSIPGSGRSCGEGHGNPLQYSCLGNPMDRGVWQTTVHEAAKSQTWFKWLSTHMPREYSCQNNMYVDTCVYVYVKLVTLLSLLWYL